MGARPKGNPHDDATRAMRRASTRLQADFVALLPPITEVELDGDEVRRVQFAAEVLVRVARTRVARARLELLDAERALGEAVDRADGAREELHARCDELASACDLTLKARAIEVA